MDKPHFIRGLLEEVGTAIDPIQLVKRIPEGLEIEGLRDGIGRMVREYEIQFSISEGVAKVLRGEVATGMDTLRAGQKRGVKFEVVLCDDDEDEDLAARIPGASQKDKEKENVAQGKDIDVKSKGVDAPTAAAKDNPNSSISTEARTSFLPDPSPPKQPLDASAPPGHCTFCHKPFTLPSADDDAEISSNPDDPIPPSRDTLVGFACGHVFHLSCLLPKSSPQADQVRRLQVRLAAEADGAAGYWGRSVGAKVANAHAVRAAVGEGCVVCRRELEVGDG